ncbi:acyltransferase [Pontibacillus sp. ALD_SL1]|nr:acyltransferase [Pontibacillus sp. ALD_SL1]
MSKRIVHDTIVNWIGGSFLVPPPLRYVIYRVAGLKTNTVRIRPNCLFNGPNIYIGKGTFINYKCYFDNAAGIKIGKNCAFGMEVLLCTSTHDIGNSLKRAGETVQLPIEIGDGCWIGARANILPGVKIGDGCIIAAGSLVTKDCEPNGLYAGLPAKRIRDLN